MSSNTPAAEKLRQERERVPLEIEGIGWQIDPTVIHLYGLTDEAMG